MGPPPGRITSSAPESRSAGRPAGAGARLSWAVSCIKVVITRSSVHLGALSSWSMVAIAIPCWKGKREAVPAPKHRGELLDDPGEVVEGVSELVPRRHRVVTEAGVVGSEHAVAVGQGRDQVAEHLRAGREAVQEQ